NTGSGDITLNAVYRDNGISLAGITTTIPVLGVDALVDLDGATLTGNKITLSALAGTLQTTAAGAQSLGTTLTVTSVAGFSDSGKFKVDGIVAECSYTGRDTTANQFTGVSGCSGSVADAAVVRTDLTENGSGTGVNHALAEL